MELPYLSIPWRRNAATGIQHLTMTTFVAVFFLELIKHQAISDTGLIRGVGNLEGHVLAVR
jgi:hypothetical protein